ncbi:Hypothetical predicted protein, partial [Mytilus galloprovincialis]
RDQRFNITTSRDNGKEKQDEDEDKVDRFTDQSDIFPSTCYVQNDKQALALACAWRGVGNNFTTEIQKNSKGTTHVQNVSRYLLCAYENTTLALACAWREIKGLTSQHQEIMEKKSKTKTKTKSTDLQII